MKNILFVTTSGELVRRLLPALNGNFNFDGRFCALIITKKDIERLNTVINTNDEIKGADMVIVDTYDGDDGFAPMRTMCESWTHQHLFNDAALSQMPLSREGMEHPGLYNYDFGRRRWYPYDADPSSQIDRIRVIFEEENKTPLAEEHPRAA